MEVGNGLSMGRASYAARLFISILFLSLIPSLMISLLFSRQAMTQARIELEETNSLYLGLLSNALEIVIGNVLDFTDLLAVDPGFNEYVSIADKDFLVRFADMPERFSEVEMKRLYNFYALRSEIYETLDTITLSNEFIHSVYFYDPSRREVFRNGALPVSIHSFSDTLWLRFLEQGVLLPHIMPLKILGIEKGGNGVPVIPMLTASHGKSIPFVLNLDARILYRRIFETVEWDPADSFFILSPEGEPLLYSMEQKDTVTQIALHADEIFEGRSTELVLGTERYLVSSRRIETMGWKVFSVSDPARWESRLRGLRIRIFLFSMCFFPLFAAVALLLGRRLYSPIRSLYGLASSFIPEGERACPEESGGIYRPERGEGLELYLIRRSLIRLDRREHELEIELDRSLPAFRREFFGGLLRGRELSDDEIAEGLAVLRSPLGVGASSLMVISPDLASAGEALTDLNSARELMLSLENEIRNNNKLFPVPAEFLILDKGRGCLLFNLSSVVLPGLHDPLKALLNSLNRSTGLTLTAAVGSPVGRLAELEGSYREALEILRLRSLADKGQLLFYEDLKLGESGVIHYRTGAKSRILTDCVKQGRCEDAQTALETIYADMAALKEKLSFARVRRIYISLLVDMYRATDELRHDGDAHTGDRFAQILEARSLEELHCLISGIACELSGSVSLAAMENRNRRVEQIIRTVEESCGRDINLNTVSDRIGLNPSYVSRLFREHMNVSFIDYLTEVRMNKAMSLLNGSEKTVGDIAAEVGYFNSNYFIRLFKKRTGRTPGEYRRLFK